MISQGITGRPKKWCAVLLRKGCAGFLAFGMLGCSSSKTAERVQQQILAKEEQQNNALLRNDAASLGPMCAAELAWTNSSGVLLSKSEMLTDLKSGKQRNSTIVHDDIRLHFYGDTVIVTGISTSHYQYNGKEFIGARRFTNVWIKQGGDWLLAVHHVTPMATASDHTGSDH
jgi:hypothetical protein